MGFIHQPLLIQGEPSPLHRPGFTRKPFPGEVGCVGSYAWVVSTANTFIMLLCMRGCFHEKDTEDTYWQYLDDLNRRLPPKEVQSQSDILLRAAILFCSFVLRAKLNRGLNHWSKGMGFPANFSVQRNWHSNNYMRPCPCPHTSVPIPCSTFVVCQCVGAHLPTSSHTPPHRRAKAGVCAHLESSCLLGTNVTFIFFSLNPCWFVFFISHLGWPACKVPSAPQSFGANCRPRWRVDQCRFAHQVFAKVLPSVGLTRRADQCMNSHRQNSACGPNGRSCQKMGARDGCTGNTQPGVWNRPMVQGGLKCLRYIRNTRPSMTPTISWLQGMEKTTTH